MIRMPLSSICSRGPASAAATIRMRDGKVEETFYPRNPLDVLAQHVVAISSMEEVGVEELYSLVRRAAPFAELPRSMFEGTLDMLSGRYPSDDFAELRPRVTWDRLAGTVRAREGAKTIAITNGGTIPDRGLYGVFLLGADKGQGRVGELDEEMVFETRLGETFLLGASTWRVEEITHDRVLVSPAPGVPGKMPFWKGEAAGRPLEFGRAIGALTRSLRSADPPEATRRLMEKHDLDEGAARNLLQRTLVEKVAAMLRHYDVSSDRVCFEVTESALMTDERLATATLIKMASLGLTALILVYRPLATTDGEYRLLGLDQRAEVLRDGHGVAHIYAQTARDLFFLQGYVTAQDRLWQMDRLRRRALGR